MLQFINSNTQFCCTSDFWRKRQQEKQDAYAAKREAYRLAQDGHKYDA